jgi:hypothetical protein
VITPHELRHLPPTLTSGPNPRVFGAIFLRQRGQTAAERGRDISSKSFKTVALNPKGNGLLKWKSHDQILVMTFKRIPGCLDSGLTPLPGRSVVLKSTIWSTREGWWWVSGFGFRVSGLGGRGQGVGGRG